MGKHKLAGFTIIETMLVLTISAVLAVSLLIGVGASINTQRYRDATDSFKSLLQQQYSDLTSVRNSRDNTWSCGSSASPTNASSVKENPGQSECMLMGKYVRVDKGAISVYSLVGYQTNPVMPTDDIKGLHDNYVYNISKVESDASDMEWGTRIATPFALKGVLTGTSTAAHKIGFLVVRSPESGHIYTFTNANANVPDIATLTGADFTKMIVAANRGERLICIDNNGLFVSNDRGVYVTSFASGSSAIEMRSNDDMVRASTTGKPDKADKC